MVAGGGMSGAMPAASAAPNTNTFAPAPSGDMEKVKRRIGWLNANGNLQGPLVFDKVGMLLVSIGDAQAMDILKKLEEHALEVRDPTGWVVTAARKMLPGGAPVAGGFVQSPTMTSPAGLVGGAVKGVIKTGLKSIPSLGRQPTWAMTSCERGCLGCVPTSRLRDRCTTIKSRQSCPRWASRKRWLS